MLASHLQENNETSPCDEKSMRAADNNDPSTLFVAFGEVPGVLLSLFTIDRLGRVKYERCLIDARMDVKGGMLLQISCAWLVWLLLCDLSVVAVPVQDNDLAFHGTPLSDLHPSLHLCLHT